MITANEAVSFMRNNYPENWNKSDYELYEMAQEKFPTVDFGEDNPYSPQIGDTATTSDTPTYGEANDSPDAISNLISSFNLNEAFAEEGIPSLGISPEIFKKSFNDSTAGLAYALKNGKFKYDIGDYQPEALASVGQFITGLANPIDAALFIGSGAIGGGLGGKLGNKFLATEWAKKGMADNAAKYIKQTTAKEALFDAAVQSGFG